MPQNYHALKSSISHPFHRTVMLEATPLANNVNPEIINRHPIEMVIFLCTSTPSPVPFLTHCEDADFPITSQDGRAIVPAYCPSHCHFTDTNECLGVGVFCLSFWGFGGWNIFLACAIETLRWARGGGI